MPATKTRKRSAKCPCGCGQAPAASCRMRKVVCTDPECQGILRVTREYLASIGVPTCGCGSACYPPCLWDRSEYDPGAMDEVIAVGTKGPASSRKKSGWKTFPQCKSCKAITSNPGRECSACGYLDGHGFIASGSSKDRIPF